MLYVINFSANAALVFNTDHLVQKMDATANSKNRRRDIVLAITKYDCIQSLVKKPLTVTIAGNDLTKVRLAQKLHLCNWEAQRIT